MVSGAGDSCRDLGWCLGFWGRSVCLEEKKVE